MVDLVPTHARQTRSRRTEQRILAATIELLGERPAEQLSIAAIAARAGVSIGGFYARFPSKDALFERLYAGVLGGVVEQARERLSPAETRGLDARAIVLAYVSLGVRTFRENRILVRQISLRNRTSSDPVLKQRILEFNRTLHDLLRQRLYERLDQMDHASPERAIDVALTSVSGAMREYVLFQDLRPHFAPVKDDVLVEELTDLFCAYLRVRP